MHEVQRRAVFLPEKGMNLLSYRKGDIEALDQTTMGLFEERHAGRGSLIGPHFHHRKQIPAVPFAEVFPHIAKLRAKGVKEPFSHGIARYAPWNVSHTKDTISSTLSGNDTWNNVLLSVLEGFPFDMFFDVQLLSSGLFLELGVEAQTPCVVGLHYYYALPPGEAFVQASVKPEYREQDIWKKIPRDWLDEKGELYFSLDQEADFGFQLSSPNLDSFIILKTQTYSIKISFQADDPEESSWQLYHPRGSSFVCIEPLSAKNPRDPALLQSTLSVKIDII